MWKKDYLRYLNSKASLGLVLIIGGMSCLSYFISLNEKQLLIKMLAESGSEPDLNIPALISIIDGYTGFQFLFDFWFNSGVSIMLMPFIYIWMGTYLTPQLQIEKDTGIGDLIVARSGYKARFRHLLIAQSLYLGTLMGMTTLLQLGLAMVFGGIPTTPTFFSSYELNSFQACLVIFVQTCWLTLNLVIANGICLLSQPLLKNKYLLQLLPFFIFVLSPIIGWTVMGNSVPALGRVLGFFSSNSILTTLSWLPSNFSFYSLVWSVIPVICGSLVLGGLYLFHLKQGSRDYL